MSRGCTHAHPQECCRFTSESLRADQQAAGGANKANLMHNWGSAILTQLHSGCDYHSGEGETFIKYEISANQSALLHLASVWRMMAVWVNAAPTPAAWRANKALWHLHHYHQNSSTSIPLRSRVSAVLMCFWKWRLILSHCHSSLPTADWEHRQFVQLGHQRSRVAEECCWWNIKLESSCRRHKNPPPLSQLHIWHLNFHIAASVIDWSTVLNWGVGDFQRDQHTDNNLCQQDGRHLPILPVRMKKSHLCDPWISLMVCQLIEDTP